MSKKAIIGIVIGLVVIGGGIGAFLYFRKKKNVGLEDIDLSVTTTGTPKATYKISYVTEDADKKIMAIHFAAPRPAKESVPTGATVRLEKMGKYDGSYTVVNTWTDDSGNQGAIYIESDLVTTSNKENKTWDGKGIINVY